MNLIQALRVSCKDATYLHEKNKEGKLSFAEKVGLRIHLLYCSLCALFFKQMDEMEKCVQHKCKQEQHIKLDSNARTKIKNALDGEINS